ncbi:MAG: hypothetical protein KIT84_03270 [Labilithrix sp.]|nr:hypothetical protein [Labilithrix sp.]MCW5810003.1 hypothetical protein [Labilithrix sp.]
MTRKHFVTSIVFGLTGVLSFACGEPDWVGGELDEDTNQGQLTNEPEEACTESGGDGKPGLGVDPSTLEACCEDKGKAHCVDEALVSSSKDKLDACGSGGRCVPDTIITGTEAKTCTSSVTNSPGKCLSPCIKAIAEKASLLKADGCTGGELCAPCELGGTPTGACEIGKPKSGGGAKTCAPKNGDKESKEPAADPPKSAGCCGGKGLCVTKDVVEAKMPGKSDQLDTHECTDGLLCAPTENAAADFEPKKCKAKGSVTGLFMGEYEGVCLSNCLKFKRTQQFASAQGDCDDEHRCMPCEVLGRPTGAPGCEQ